jgi:epoxyqueuosine reductase
MAGGRAGVADLCGPRFLNTLNLSPAELKAALADQARALGFDCIGVTDPGAIVEAGQHFREFLDAGAHGDMAWLAANTERRTDPRVLWPGVRSVIMLGVNYGPDENPLAILAQRSRGAISVYAQGDDYHDLIKKRLKALARWLVSASGGEVNGKATGTSRRARLAGQAHQPRLAPIRFMAVSRCDLYRCRSAAR